MRISSKLQKMMDHWSGEWNVYIEDFNAKTIKSYNVFTHRTFLQGIMDAYSHNETVLGFSAEVERWARCCFWSKCEYEVLVSGWPPTPDRTEETKIDVFDQLKLNWKHFIFTLWDSLEKRFNNGAKLRH